MIDVAKLKILERFNPTKLTIDSTQYRFFGGTAYLGLLQEPDFVELYKAGIDRYGVNNGTSRNNNVQLAIYDHGEEVLAKRFGFQAATLFSSGFLAGQATVRSLTDREAALFVAPDAHPALWLFDGTAKTSAASAAGWLDRAIDQINQQEREAVICVNSLNNLMPSLQSFNALQKLSPTKRVTLIIDDSHGLGIRFKNQVSFPEGVRSMPNVDVIVVASLAKGLGVDCGVALGSAEAIRKIRKHPIFIGASPPSPAAIYALVESDSIYDVMFGKLQNNISFFVEFARELDLQFVPKFPVFTSSDARCGDRLLEKKIVISSFNYPLPESPKLNRIVISSSHSYNDLRHLAVVLAKLGE